MGASLARITEVFGAAGRVVAAAVLLAGAKPSSVGAQSFSQTELSEAEKDSNGWLGSIFGAASTGPAAGIGGATGVVAKGTNYAAHAIGASSGDHTGDRFAEKTSEINLSAKSLDRWNDCLGDKAYNSSMADCWGQIGVDHAARSHNAQKGIQAQTIGNVAKSSIKNLLSDGSVDLAEDMALRKTGLSTTLFRLPPELTNTLAAAVGAGLDYVERKIGKSDALKAEEADRLQRERQARSVAEARAAAGQKQKAQKELQRQPQNRNRQKRSDNCDVDPSCVPMSAIGGGHHGGRCGEVSGYWSPEYGFWPQEKGNQLPNDGHWTVAKTWQCN